MSTGKGIPIKNIYYMLSYAFTSLERSYDEEIAGEEFDNIHDLFAAIISKGISHQLKQGLYREYVEMKEETSSLHGKIEIHGTARLRSMHSNKVVCEFDDFSKNNIYNQVIKTTANLLLRSDNVKQEYQDSLRRELNYFAEVDNVLPTEVNWSAFRFHRNNQTYRMLLGISQMVLEGMLLTTDSGEFQLARFVDDQRMCRLFEKFILEYYRKEFPELKANPSQISWALDDGSAEMLPVMQTDITLTQDGRILIIDAKYYSHTTQTQYDKRTIHSNNLYQIFTYVKNKEAELAGTQHEVSGMLLYAQTDEEIQPDNTYQMSGNQIRVKTLDLNCEFSKIAEQLNAIADDYFQRK